MAPENEFILSNDGLNLHMHHWVLDNPTHVLCVIHGLGEHGGRYQSMAEKMLDEGKAVLALDLRGHGLSQGKKGHAKKYEYFLSDIEEMLKYARLEYIDTPMILYGHSMGGNLVTSFLLQKMTSELAGFILSSPFYEVAFEPPSWKIKLTKMMGSIWPSLTQSNELDVEAISRIPEEVEKYKNDELVHDQISVRLFLDLIRNGQDALRSEKVIELPGLVFHGNEDHLVSFNATEKKKSLK